MNYKLIENKLLQIMPEMDIIEQIFTSRGMNLKDINHYLNTTNEDILDPQLIMNIKEGAKMLIKHIHEGDKVLIQIDSDADGFTSSALLLNYLNCLFPAFVKNNISYRFHTGKQHGIPLEIIDDIINKGYKLIIAPDAASNDYEQHRILKENNVDVLIIDHHEAEKVSKDACVINNQLCDYPTKSLSGVGMVYKFCSYIDKILDENYANLFIDLVSVGIMSTLC